MTTLENPATPDDPVLFWADVDPTALWRGVALALLFMAPLAFLAPAGYIAAGLASLLLRSLNQRSFRFHLSARELRLKLNVFMPVMPVALVDIASVAALPDAGGGFLPLAPRSGHLLIAKTDGTQILVPGIKDAAEAVEAITRLKRQAQSGGEEHRQAA